MFLWALFLGRWEFVLFQEKNKPPAKGGFVLAIGGRDGTRTRDPLNAIQVLSQTELHARHRILYFFS